MFLKKRINLKRSAALYCGEHQKKIQMKLLEENVEAFGPSPDTWMQGKESWQCPKCHNKIYIQYKIDISKRYL